LRHFGATVTSSATSEGGRRITVTGQPELIAADLVIPGDPSSAAFPAVAALLLPNSAIEIQGVGMNPLRAGLFETLAEMGAAIELKNQRIEGGEMVADLSIRAGALKGVTVPAERAPSMIDEYPILAVAAAFASGRMVMHGLAELRVKESDRLAAIATGLTACGVTVAIEGDTLIVEGTGSRPKGGAKVAAALDHRIAMSFLVLGMAAERPVTIDDGATIATSFPDFVPLINRLGGAITGAAS
jgi:3-phosphoshikimate 1-carboxyvinyltransferase